VRVKRILDLTRTLTHNQPNLPGLLPPPQIELVHVGPKDGWNTERITLLTHHGTHMDAPWHLNGCGPLTIDSYPVADFQGEAVVIDLRAKGQRGAITAEDLEPYRLQPGQIALLVTGWFAKVAYTDEWAWLSPFVHPDGARHLVERGVKGIVIDHPSVGGQGPENEETHRILLSNRVWVAEAIDVPPELFERPAWHLFALPLKVHRASGAPARVIAVEYEEGVS
jgi:arylformamidase